MPDDLQTKLVESLPPYVREAFNMERPEENQVRPVLPESFSRLPKMPSRFTQVADKWDLDPYAKKISLSDAQAWSADPEFQKRFPAFAAMNTRTHPWSTENSLPYKAGEMVRGALGGAANSGFGSWLGSTVNSGYLPALLSIGALGGLAGLGGGALYGAVNKANDPYSSSWDEAKHYGVRGLMAGGLAGLLSHYLRGLPNTPPVVKSAGLTMNTPSTMIYDAVQSSSGFSRNDKEDMFQTAFSMPDPTKAKFISMMGMAGGALTGGLLAGRMFGGMAPTMLGAAVGGWLGKKFGDTTPRNAFGQPYHGRVDFFGTPY